MTTNRILVPYPVDTDDPAPFIDDAGIRYSPLSYQYIRLYRDDMPEVTGNVRYKPREMVTAVTKPYGKTVRIPREDAEALSCAYEILDS